MVGSNDIHFRNAIDTHWYAIQSYWNSKDERKSGIKLVLDYIFTLVVAEGTIDDIVCMIYSNWLKKTPKNKEYIII